MAGKRYTPEQIIAKLREADVWLAQALGGLKRSLTSARCSVSPSAVRAIGWGNIDPHSANPGPEDRTRSG